MLVLKKKKENKLFRNHLINYLQKYWKQNCNPSLKEIKNDLHIRNIQLLKKTLRHLRTDKILDGAYDDNGVYRIYPFKSLKSESILYSNTTEL
ncbi:MAG: hypothetical protein ACFFHV_07685 [Promethearchaeota archaeon]